MKPPRLFDASSIVTLVIKNRLQPLRGSYTLDLAGYEIGNYLWKEHSLAGSLSNEEVAESTEIFRDVLEGMNLIRAAHPHPQVTQLATEAGLTYYDAAYLHATKEIGATLLTEDKELEEKAREFVDVSTSKDA